MTENVQGPKCGGYKVEHKGDGSRDPLGCILGSIVGVFFTGGLSLLALPFAFLDKSDPQADGSIEYKCQLGVYRWFHIPVTPWLTVNVRPELIREGAEKLRQEEERRRLMND